MTNESLLRRLKLQMNIVVIHAISTGHSTGQDFCIWLCFLVEGNNAEGNDRPITCRDCTHSTNHGAREGGIYGEWSK